MDSPTAVFFAALHTYLEKEIQLKVEEETIEFLPEVEEKNDEVPTQITQLTVKFEYGDEDPVTSSKARIVVRIQVKQTANSKPVLRFEHLEGNSLYYKLLVQAIKNQFKQA